MICYNIYSNDSSVLFINDDNNTYYREENFEDNGQYLPYRPGILETNNVSNNNNTNSTLLGTIHSDDHSYQLGIIEPTESEVNNNGVYWGDAPSKPIIYIPTRMERIVVKTKKCYDKVKNKYDSEILKALERQRKEYEWGKKTKYIDGYGWVSNGMYNSLQKGGYMIWEGKVIKIPRKKLLY
jgi:hypothetical protein